MGASLRLATRGSPLALAQSRSVAAELSGRLGADVQLVEVQSEGDLSTQPLTQIGGTGVFVGAVREALLEGRADIAVHSLKDLPTTPCPGIRLAAVPPRSDPRDALCAQGITLSALIERGSAAKIGTGSPRRAAQLRMLLPECQVIPVRGNVQTRLARVGDDLDAVVLAVAGLQRIGLSDAITETLNPELMLPAPGQGALAVEARTDLFAEAAAALVDLDDPATRACVTAERAMLAELEAGCSAPVGALATADEPGYWQPEVHLRGGVFGRGEEVRGSITGSVASADELGRALAHRLLDEGAAALMTETS